MWLAQVPSPAQAEQLDWYVPWCFGASPVDQLVLCASGLLRLGVKRLANQFRKSFEYSLTTIINAAEIPVGQLCATGAGSFQVVGLSGRVQVGS